MQVDENGHALAVGPPAAAAALLAATTSASSTSAHGAALASTGTSNGSSSNDQHGSHTGTLKGSHPSSSAGNLAASQRSMALWERVSPGMMPDTTKTPPPTTAEAYTYEPERLEPVDFTHHLKRTDFAEYTECALRQMHHIKAAAKK